MKGSCFKITTKSEKHLTEKPKTMALDNLEVSTKYGL